MGSRFALFDRDNWHPDPRKNRFCYKRGDVVSVSDSSEPLGVISPESKILLFDVPDLPIELGKIYLSKYRDETPLDIRDDSSKLRTEKIQRRLFRFDIDHMPTQIQADLRACRYVVWSMGFEALKPFIHNLRTGESELTPREIILFKRNVSSRLRAANRQ